MQARQIEIVESRDGAAETIDRKAGKLGTAQRELDQMRAGEDVRHQSAVFQVVGCEAGAIFPVQPVDLADLVAGGYLAAEIVLSAPEQGTCHGLELEAFEAPECRA